jgi:hypothetical protein
MARASCLTSLCASSNVRIAQPRGVAAERFGFEIEATPGRAAVGTTDHVPDDAIFDQRRQRLAVVHVGRDGVLDR